MKVKWYTNYDTLFSNRSVNCFGKLFGYAGWCIFIIPGDHSKEMWTFHWHYNFWTNSYITTHNPKDKTSYVPVLRFGQQWNQLKINENNVTTPRPTWLYNFQTNSMKQILSFCKHKTHYILTHKPPHPPQNLKRIKTVTLSYKSS